MRRNRLRFETLRRRLRPALTGPHILAFLPAMTLGSYWLGGEAMLMFAAFLVPALAAAVGGFTAERDISPIARDSVSDLPWSEAASARLDTLADAGRLRDGTVSCLAIGVDGADTLLARYGPAGRDRVIETSAQRLLANLRSTDLVCRHGSAGFAVVLDRLRPGAERATLEAVERLRSALAEPIAHGDAKIHVTASVGYSMPHDDGLDTGAAVIDGAERALAEAQSTGGNAIRAFTDDLRQRDAASALLAAEIADALETGQIEPWFQPQIDAATGRLTGVEALARWNHPERGVLLPAIFLPMIEAAGLGARLGQAMLGGALEAIATWDRDGLHVPAVSVNCCPNQLRDPQLVDRVKWALDGAGVSPERLRVEVLEDVIAGDSTDVVTRNVWAFSALGCPVELDDFGTGQSSIGNIRRFGVRRIKIDRSFVTRTDVDPEQANMVRAILGMARQLGLTTVAEGIETEGEMRMLAALGVNDLQGFAISPALSRPAFEGWLHAHPERRPLAAPEGNQKQTRPQPGATPAAAPAKALTGKTA